MKQIFLIAWREYRQYIFSRGFLLFLAMFPIGFVGISAAIGVAESTKPVRYFTIYEPSNAFSADIIASLDRQHSKSVIDAWDLYYEMMRMPESAPLPAPFEPATVDRERITSFAANGGVEAAIAAAASQLRKNAPPFLAPRKTFEFVPLPDNIADAQSLAGAEQALRPYLLEETLIETPAGENSLFAALLIPNNYGAREDGQPAQYWSRNLTDTALEFSIANALTQSLKRRNYNDLGVGDDHIIAIEALDAPLDAFRPDRDADNAKLGLKDRIESGLPAAMTYMLLVIIFGVGNLLLTNTIEERSNKIVEVLLSSVTANQLMMGKLIGIGAVGLTMPTIFMICGIGMSTTINAGGGDNVASTIISTLLSSNFLFIYLFYFLCAYLIFAMIFLAIGAVSNSLQDAQSYMGPVMLLVFAPLPFMIMVFQNPNGVVASILTWIPIYTPYAVMMRAASDPPLWEILGATILMLGFAAFLMRIMGRIFRQAILQSSPAKIGDIWRLAQKETA